MEDDRIDIQLDKTCFYPRGGEQDWDKGIITNESSPATFAVHEVRLDENAVVHHIGVYQSGELKSGDTVHCSVDANRREINTRLHSAGHLVDMAVDHLGLSWIAGKGAHYPHMSFVEYDAVITPKEAEIIQKDIERVANKLIAKGSRNEIRFMPFSAMHTVCKHVPENIPTTKPARVVLYDEAFGIPCGGTHVKDVHDIGRITISKVKSKKGITKVSYTVEGIN
ncbi:MAG TPA: alanine--tRNA ligase-related protein [Candidatus Chromulinivoraceae bacterium]|nr:alanine--tRNA ligase-related protein [Candidatus Chromulinivoraceae bacterium]